MWHCLLSSDFVKNFASRSPSICSERLSLSLFELDRATSIHLSFFFFLSYRATSEDVELRSTKAYAISDTYEQTILCWTTPTTARKVGNAPMNGIRLQPIFRESLIEHLQGEYCTYHAFWLLSQLPAPILCSPVLMIGDSYYYYKTGYIYLALGGSPLWTSNYSAYCWLFPLRESRKANLIYTSR